jgi:hypothetical protein
MRPCFPTLLAAACVLASAPTDVQVLTKTEPSWRVGGYIVENRLKPRVY